MPCRQASTYNNAHGSGSPSGGGYATEADCLQACKEGACCNGTTCTVKPQCQCNAAAGEVFKGIGTVCSPNPCGPVLCTDCCPNLLNASDFSQKSVSLAIDLSFSSECGGQAYSASLNQTATATNRVGCPFGPLCSNCIFYSSVVPSGSPICQLQTTISITVANGKCFAGASIQPSFRASSWGACNSQGFVCPGFTEGATQGFFISASSVAEFYSASGCMDGVVFPFNTAATGFGNIVQVAGNITVLSNPLP